MYERSMTTGTDAVLDPLLDLSQLALGRSALFALHLGAHFSGFRSALLCFELPLKSLNVALLRIPLAVTVWAVKGLVISLPAISVIIGNGEDDATIRADLGHEGNLHCEGVT